MKEPIAIVGMACRLPGAGSVESLWRLLERGGDAITEIPRDRLNVDAYYDPTPASPGKIVTRKGGFLEQIDKFDASFFGVSPREAIRMDPQQRLLLELAWEAFEDAGIVPERLGGRNAGVFVGMWASDYEQRMFNASSDVDLYTTTGGGRYAAAGRLSYVLDLRGPSMTVDTACSSSLVAVHLACQSIRSGESDLALACGVNLILQPHITIGYSRGRMLSPDARCHFGDASANGYVRSEGAGVVLLKALSKALDDGDPIHALIRGSAVNNDGRGSGLLVAPSSDGQEQMLLQAYNDAGVSPAAVHYMEAHGTGTPVGDPVELKALGAVLSQGRSSDQLCQLGSIKTNIGHAEAASGLAGLIKAVLVLENRKVPGNPHFRQPNPNIAWDTLPLIMQRELGPLQVSGGPAIASVNSFGITGTNSHVILEEAPDHRNGSPHALGDDSVARLLLLSARSAGALAAVAQRYREWFAVNGDSDLRDVCYTAALRRSHHQHRLAIIASHKNECVQLLSTFLNSNNHETILGTGVKGNEALDSLAARYVQGETIDWNVLYPTSGSHVFLPTYPWQRERFWFESLDAGDGAVARAAAAGAMASGTRAGDRFGDAGPSGEIGNYFYRTDWEPEKIRCVDHPAGVAGTWIVFADRGGVGQSLVNRLEGAGANCALVYAGDSADFSNSRGCTISPRKREDFRALVDRVCLGEAARCKGIVYLWSLDIPSCDGLTEGQLQDADPVGCNAMLNLVQALAGTPMASVPRVWLVSRNAQRVDPADVVEGALQATLWGFGRTFANEHPEFSCARVDLGTADDTEVHALADELLADSREEEVALRGSVRYVSRLVQWRPSAGEMGIGTISPEGTYLITGGFGGIGLVVSKWLVTLGARNLILVGRHGASANSQAALDDLRAAGARIFEGKADVSDARQLDDLFAEAGRSMPPVRGVFHAAGVLDDGVLLQLNAERFRTVMAPKMLGAWNLHRKTLDTRLDYFVLFSSAIGLLGSPGQANYAAANTFLDGLAAYRRAHGLPGLSIDWGPWSDVGLASRQNRGNRLARRGLTSIAPHDAVSALGVLLSRPEPQFAVMPFELDAWYSFNPRAAKSAFFKNLRGGEMCTDVSERTPSTPSAAQNSFPGAESGERGALNLEELVRSELSKVLCIPTAKIDVNKPFQSLGIDSLMALELRNSLQALSGLILSPTIIWNYPTVKQLTAYLGQQVPAQKQSSVPNGEASTGPAEKAEENGRIDRILAEIERLSDEEVHRSITEDIQQDK